MYRSGDAGLQARNDALERELEALRSGGPPGADTRITALEGQQQRLRRLGPPFNWLVLLLPLAFVSSAASWLYTVPFVAAALHLGVELRRQRLALRRGLPVPQPAAAPRDDGARTEEARHEALAREHALYWSTGTRDGVMREERDHERLALDRQGRPFLWFVVAAVLALGASFGPDRVDPALYAIAALVLALAGFARRSIVRARDLQERLSYARKEARAANAAEADGPTETVSRSEHHQLESELQELRVDRDKSWVDRKLLADAQSVAALIFGFGVVVAVPLGASTQLPVEAGVGSFLRACFLLVAAVASVVVGIANRAVKRRNDRFEVAELKVERATRQLQRVRVEGGDGREAGRVRIGAADEERPEEIEERARAADGGAGSTRSGAITGHGHVLRPDTRG